MVPTTDEKPPMTIPMPREASTESIDYPSPVGTLRIAATENGICGLTFERGADKRTVDFTVASPDESSPQRQAHLRRALFQLDEYFAGGRTTFDLDLDIVHGTPFQRKVWDALRQIPYGQTWSYGRLATEVGNPQASRAVGGANNKNPIAVIIPCHRVIGADGSLVGFGGGLDIKQQLLALESQHR